MTPTRKPPSRPTAAVLTDWRRLERVLEAGLGDDDERDDLRRRIEELKAEYRIATGDDREHGPPADHPPRLPNPPVRS